MKSTPPGLQLSDTTIDMVCLNYMMKVKVQ